MLNKQKLSEPVVLAFITAAVPILAAFILQVLEGTDILDNALWLRTLLTGIGVLVGTLTSAWARSQVLSPATAAKHGLPDPANLPNTPNFWARLRLAAPVEAAATRHSRRTAALRSVARPASPTQNSTTRPGHDPRRPHHLHHVHQARPSPLGLRPQRPARRLRHGEEHCF
jgi:hypothetical protein